MKQLERSFARKELTRKCSKAIIHLVQHNTNSSSSQEKIYQAYISASRITLGVAVEALTDKEIPVELVSENQVLSLFNSDIKQIINFRKESLKTPKDVKSLKIFIKKNRKTISEEDLGGISELFSGHKAIWENGVVKLIHNKERRDAGKIYTPYDVTEFMCYSIVKNLISKFETIEQLFQSRVLDPAVGSGAFCSQFVRLLWKSSKRKWRLDNEKEFRIRVCEDMIHACDIDNQALQLAKVVMWISAGCPESNLSLNFSLVDSLAAGPCVEISKWSKHTRLPCSKGYDAVFGNPPYVRVKQEFLSDFSTSKSKNLYSAFTELSINLLNDSGQFCFIVPQSVIGGKDTQALRDFLFRERAKIIFHIFDSVPDFLFDQGKIESNTNTNINQRTTIISLTRSKRKTIYTSPLLRWRRREERDLLFNSLKRIRIKSTDLIGGNVPMLADNDDLKLYRRLIEEKNTINDAIDNNSSKTLYVPKAVRYFITAIPINLERPNSIKINIKDDYYELIHVILNSNLFYWWWRVNGNGFQVEMKDILSFPLIQMNRGIANNYSQKLDEALEECRVFKRNAGKDIPNINYNYRQDILQDIDNELLSTINHLRHSRIFGCKTNSLTGDMSKLVGYKGE